MSVFGVSLLDLVLLTFCFSVPFAVLALVVTVLYRRDRRRTPPEAANIAGDIHPRYPRPAATRRHGPFPRATETEETDGS
jgi:hypothetical protein